MRILRSVMVTPMPELERMMVVVRDVDMAVPLEEINATGEFGFVLEEIFEMPDDTSILNATIEAERRTNPEDERNMAILYYWTHMHFVMLKPGGIVMSTQPAPLSEEQIRYVWGMLASLTDYEGYNFKTITKDGRSVTFKED
jgi:hypothetical protein